MHKTDRALSAISAVLLLIASWAYFAYVIEKALDIESELGQLHKLIGELKDFRDAETQKAKTTTNTTINHWFSDYSNILGTYKRLHSVE